MRSKYGRIASNNVRIFVLVRFIVFFFNLFVTLQKMFIHAIELMKKLKSLKPTTFAKNLKALASEKKLTIRELAKLAGVSPSTINDWQSGTSPENYIAVKNLAKALNVSFSFLLTGEYDEIDQTKPASIAEVFTDGGALFDGYAKITIQRLLPKKG